MKTNDYSRYMSPFSWRYGSEKMRRIFSEENKYRLWRKVWVALAKAEAKEGLVSKEELADLEKHQNDIDIERIWEIEKDTRHDVVAAIKEFSEKAKIGGGKIHLGATSMDITDNAETVRIKEALLVIEDELKKLLKAFGQKRAKEMEKEVLAKLELEAFEITNQTAPRKIEFWVASLLAGVTQSLNKFAFDVRFMQSPGLREWEEPFSKSQVGS